MRAYRLDHLSDTVLLRDLAALVAQDRTTTASLLAHVAEVDARRLYLPAGYPSMYAYCVEELHLSEDGAYKRIQAARAARQFPVLFSALAEGRVHMSAVVRLAPHLTPENVDELLTDATHKSKSEVEQLLTQRFPRPDLPTTVQAAAPLPDEQLVPEPVGTQVSEPVGAVTEQLVPGQVQALAPQPTLAPPAPRRFALQVTLEQATHEKLRYAQALLSHAIPSGDVAQVLDRALDALISQLEKRKFGAATKPGRPRRSTTRPRYVPAHVRRAVWERDQGRCTFVGTTGHRCAARRFLQFDHIEPVARGGQATVKNARLRCRAHNQFEAERTFGAGFMSEKREQARRRAAEARARTAAAEERVPSVR